MIDAGERSLAIDDQNERGNRGNGSHCRRLIIHATSLRDPPKNQDEQRSKDCTPVDNYKKRVWVLSRRSLLR